MSSTEDMTSMLRDFAKLLLKWDAEKLLNPNIPEFIFRLEIFTVHCILLFLLSPYF